MASLLRSMFDIQLWHQESMKYFIMTIQYHTGSVLAALWCFRRRFASQVTYIPKHILGKSMKCLLRSGLPTSLGNRHCCEDWAILAQANPLYRLLFRSPFCFTVVMLGEWLILYRNDAVCRRISPPVTLPTSDLWSQDLPL